MLEPMNQWSLNHYNTLLFITNIITNIIKHHYIIVMLNNYTIHRRETSPTAPKFHLTPQFVNLGPLGNISSTYTAFTTCVRATLAVRSIYTMSTLVLSNSQAHACMHIFSCICAMNKFMHTMNKNNEQLMFIPVFISTESLPS